MIIVKEFSLIVIFKYLRWQDELNIYKLKKRMIKLKYNEEYIKICIQYAERLKKNSLPIIFDAEHLRLLIGVEKYYFRNILNKNFEIYREIQIDKKLGGKRDIVVPIDGLKFIQRWILEHVLENIPVSNNCMGFMKGLSIVDNAKIHVNNNLLINLDIKDFFPSIKFIQVYRIFRYYGYTKEVSKIFAKLCTYRGVLPQGAPTSPYLSNIVCKKLDKRLSLLANKIGANYSRYADDITFSGDNQIKIYLNLIIKIVEEEGFIINKSKTRIHNNNQRQMVTGLIVNKKLAVPKEFENKFKLQIYFCSKFGVYGHLKHIGLDGISSFKEYMYGTAYFIRMVDYNKGSKYLGDLDNIQWEY